ncbi:hypothetical protein [Mitsuokella jalaludinii]|uniref:hypothetical protein n=1 Tax=Mitsuokella jalaludinii TaxID=187979 RepID=UPI00307A4BAF
MVKNLHIEAALLIGPLALAGVQLGQPQSVQGAIRPILENEVLFGVNLYEAGLADKVERMLSEMLAGPGAVRATLKKELQ